MLLSTWKWDFVPHHVGYRAHCRCCPCVSTRREATLACYIPFQQVLRRYSMIRGVAVWVAVLFLAVISNPGGVRLFPRERSM